MAAAFSVAAMVSSGALAVALIRHWHGGGYRTVALAYWAASLAMFSGASLMLAAGELDGWTEGTFRAFYLLGGVLNVPWLALGTIEINADDPRVRRVVAIAVGASAVLSGGLAVVATSTPPEVFVGALILGVIWAGAHAIAGADGLRQVSLLLVGGLTGAAVIVVVEAQLGGVVVPDAMPAGRELFGHLPRAFAFAGNTIGSVVVLSGTLASAWLRRRHDPRSAKGNALIAAGVGVAAFGGTLSFLGATAANAVGLGIGAVLMYVGFRLATTKPGTKPGTRPGPEAGGGESGRAKSGADTVAGTVG